MLDKFESTALVMKGAKVIDPVTNKTYVIRDAKYHENCTEGLRFYCENIESKRIEVFTKSEFKHFDLLGVYRPAKELVDIVEKLDGSEPETRETRKSERIRDEVREEIKRRGHKVPI